MQTDAETTNIVGRIMLGVVASLLAVACKRMQQLTVGRIQPLRFWRPCVMRLRGPNNVRRAVQTDPTLLYYASAITEQKKCWNCLLKSWTGFKLCATTPENTKNMRPHATEFTMLRPLAQGFRRYIFFRCRPYIVEHPSRACPSLGAFKRHVKTDLSRLAFS